MIRAARVVEHLRLRAESESAVRQALPALEDAMRTASLPDVGARLICVRRLHLGQIPANASPQGVARHVEQRFAAADWRVVHAGDTSGNVAQAVWFRDAFEAHEIAALRLAAGRPLDAWFWPLALPAVMAAPSDQRLRATAFAIAATEEAPGALPAWTATLVRAGYRARLLGALRPNDGHALLRAAGVSRRAIERARTAAATSQGAPDVRLTNTTVDDREIFVEVMVDRPSGRVTRESVAVVERTLPQSKNETLAAPLAPHVETPADSAPAPAGGVAQPTKIEQPPPASPAGHSESAGDPRAAVDSGQAADADSDASAARDELQRPEAVGRVRSPRDADETFAAPWRLPYAAPTSAGGLLFLLPVLEHVGFAKWAQERAPEEPEPEVLAAAILNLLLSRLRVAEDDPIWGLAAIFGVKPEDCGVAEVWLTGCRRFLRRRLRIGLASLVRRRARLAVTSTHVDVFFGLNAADVRIRRAGLDIDPGWVAWFARVVSFHYEDRPWN